MCSGEVLDCKRPSRPVCIPGRRARQPERIQQLHPMLGKLFGAQDMHLALAAVYRTQKIELGDEEVAPTSPAKIRRRPPRRRLARRCHCPLRPIEHLRRWKHYAAPVVTHDTWVRIAAGVGECGDELAKCEDGLPSMKQPVHLVVIGHVMAPTRFEAGCRISECHDEAAPAPSQAIRDAHVLRSNGRAGQEV